jgi:hypothetical protein
MMNFAMRPAHASFSAPAPCRINAAPQYKPRVLGGIAFEGTKAMTARYRPIHCGFETLRHAAEQRQTARRYRGFGVANEQMIARATGTSTRISRPNAIFSDFREY